MFRSSHSFNKAASTKDTSNCHSVNSSAHFSGLTWFLWCHWPNSHPPFWNSLTFGIPFCLFLSYFGSHFFLGFCNFFLCWSLWSFSPSQEFPLGLLLFLTHTSSPLTSSKRHLIHEQGGWRERPCVQPCGLWPCLPRVSSSCHFPLFGGHFKYLSFFFIFLF